MADTPFLLAVHADWSAVADKRWACHACRQPDGVWQARAPSRVGDIHRFLPDLQARAQNAPVGLGVDFPDFLRGLTQTSPFFDVCPTLGDISAARPFYPRRGYKGMTRAAHAAALGLRNANALSRACDRATDERPAGAPLFWTLGANQTGKAAITAWRDLLLPAFAAGLKLHLWPFAGDFRALLQPGHIAMAETYPAQALRILGLRLHGSKRRQQDRAALAPALLHAMQHARVQPDPGLRHAVQTGFGAQPHGEDQFDSLLGLLNVIAVIDGRTADTTPEDPCLRRWEGWVLGQTALPRAPAETVGTDQYPARSGLQGP